jgi:hypothetical protein
MRRIVFSGARLRCRVSRIRLSRLARRRENYRCAVAENPGGRYLYPVPQSLHLFSPAVLMYAPACAGSYTLWDRDRPIFIGHARAPSTILGCLMDHYCGRARPSQATHCSWEPAYAEVA